MDDLRNKLLFQVTTQTVSKTQAKLSIVGAGQVGMACALSILQQHFSDELALVDIIPQKLREEYLDLLQGSLFLKSKIVADTDYAVTANSKLCIITAGVRQKDGLIAQLQRNLESFKTIIPNLVKHSPDAILLIVSSPVDIMSYVAWKLSGFPFSRIIGIGTHLDSALYRFLLGQKLQINPTSIHAYLIGEHGDSSVAIWNSANVAGILLADINLSQASSEGPAIHKLVIDSGNEITSLKGCASWATAIAVTNISQAIMKNLRTINLVSTFAKDQHGITQDVFLSLPCILGSGGVCGVLKQILQDEEKAKLNSSANDLWKMQEELAF
ncbi:L-lactate dehydrogenase A chain [Callorhinchus milii]|uniref:L-lactate dehydrogenase n=1 Tax=Callorhinchus milii TaxID=7868 RepID=A0A4W3JBZ7_CALMI|nr:L-lactate dehydrogenase A chain [Callorhinchus milii]XP_007885904.1 L-lactate dehydrogenase A chain [Callorhinchus milii]|eukprot:gi/632941509/ref/XP_007885903.1/ PREDICTED: L-lactate dehydrogenase A chain-like [Callorhinchus milii]